MTNKILIIGGSGFIGKNLIIEYLKKEFQVINFDIIEFKIFHKNFINIEGNINEFDKIEDIMKYNEIKHIVFLTNSILPTDDFTYKLDEKISTNINSVIKILNLAQKYKINKFVYFSSGGAVYGNYKKSPYRETDKLSPVSFYGWSKKVVEDYLITFANKIGINYLILRPSNPYGRFQNIYGKQGIIGIILRKIIRNEEIEIYGDGSVVKDYIYINDLMKVYFRILMCDNWNQIYNIGSGIGSSINEILKISESISNIKIKKKYNLEYVPDINVNILNVDKLKKEIGNIDFLDINEGINLFWKYSISEAVKFENEIKI